MFGKVEPKKSEWPSRLEDLAREAEPAALQKAPEIFAEAVASHKADVAAFKFECRRHGDFLTIFVERNGKVSSGSPWHEPVDSLVKFSTVINIGMTRTFKNTEGRKPDNNGVLRYEFQQVRVDKTVDDGLIGWTGSHDGEGPRDGWKYEILPKYPSEPYLGRMIFSEQNEIDGGCTTVMFSHHEYIIRHTTPNYPRIAVDDEVFFSGPNVTIYAPAGEGAKVLDIILKEIGK